MLELSLREAAGRNGPSGVGIGGSGDGAAGVEAAARAAPAPSTAAASVAAAQQPSALVPAQGSAGPFSPPSVPPPAPEAYLNVFQDRERGRLAETAIMSQLINAFSPDRQAGDGNDNGDGECLGGLGRANSRRFLVC